MTHSADHRCNTGLLGYTGRGCLNCDEWVPVHGGTTAARSNTDVPAQCLGQATPNGCFMHMVNVSIRESIDEIDDHELGQFCYTISQ